MKRSRRYALGGALAYGIVLLLLVVLFLIDSRDELLYLFLIGFPTDVLFYFVSDNNWSMAKQVIAVGLLGCLQYGGVGYCVAYLTGSDLPEKSEGLRSDVHQI